MTSRRKQEDGKEDPSPLSSPALGALSTSPEQNLLSLRDRNDGNLSVPSPREPMRLSMDTSSSTDYDQLPRSPLLEPDAGLGPSGLDRIRQQPLSRVFTLPNASTSSIGQHQSPPNPSGTSSRAASVYQPAGGSIPPFEDLHRFPSESLHSFSFAERSEELLATRQNILKRSIDFMKDRLGWAASGPGIVSAQTRISGDSEFQGMVDLLSKASVLDGDQQHGRQVGSNLHGPITSPPEVEANNVFEKSFHSPAFPQHQSAFPQYPGDAAEAIDDSHFLNPMYDDNIYSRRRDLRSAPSSRRVSLKRTYTDLSSLSLQSKLMETLAHPYAVGDSLTSSAYNLGLGIGPAVHTHSSKWTPVSQAVFRTEAKAPWTIIAANDLACLVFGVTQSEVRKLSILEVVQEERRQWLESKLEEPTTDAAAKSTDQNIKSRFTMSRGNGVTAQLLCKPSSRQKSSRRAQTDDGYGSSKRNQRKPNHAANKSRGVLLCGDVVPIQKRNGLTGSASLWVMEKRGGLIWVLEEITENVAYLTCDAKGFITNIEGDTDEIWGHDVAKTDISITKLFPQLPPECVGDDEKIVELKYFGARGPGKSSIPTTVTKSTQGDKKSLRVSSFPHVAGMMVLSSSTLKIISSNSVFSSALFGQEHPEGHHISELIPDFEKFLATLTEEDNIPLVDGMVIPEHSFRRARELLSLRENRANAVSIFLESEGLPARHRDGSRLSIDVQMRIVKSETVFPDSQSKRKDGGELSNVAEPNEFDDEDESADIIAVTEVVYALWVTYSRQIHIGASSAALSSSDQAATERPSGRSMQPSRSGQRTPSPTPTLPSHSNTPSLDNKTPLSLLSHKLNEAASTPLADRSMREPIRPQPPVKEISKKRTISDYVIIEEMGQGAYGQVKLARLKKNPATKMVLKYVTKKRILVDTWTRDRRLGTVPLEIHVLDYLRRDGLRHPNIVEMEGFFEDEINYYIEMKPHGLPGMDLFDYIELKSNMDEGECRNIFRQVVGAIQHLHTKALVVHRDIKDENVVLDGEGRIKLIDFGSAAYIKNGPFDVFVGTIDYAAPEVLQGKSYRGKEQDVWALGILLYTIVYKENPFYNVDEILDHPLRVPFLPFSEDCIDLIRRMLDRDVDNRITISEVAEHPWMVAS